MKSPRPWRKPRARKPWISLRSEPRRYWWVVLLVFVVASAGLMVAGIVSAAPVPPGHLQRPSVGNGTPPAFVQTTSTSEYVVAATQTFWQNGTAQYADGSTAANFLISVGTTYTNVISTSAVLTMTMQGALTPRINMSQGTILVNATVPYSIQLPLVVSGTMAHEKIVAAYTQTGSVPAVGVYHAFDNLSVAATFFYQIPAAWVLNSSGTGNWNITYTLAAPLTASLNNTVAYVPFPTNTSVNFSSISAHSGKTLFRSYQVAAGGVYLIIPSLAAASTTSINVSFSPAPVLIGATPLLMLNVTSLASNGTYTASTFWYNGATQPYAGIYMLLAPTNYSIDPGSVRITAGITKVSNGSFVVTGNRITVLANTFVTKAGHVVPFVVNYRLLGAPPSLIIGDTTTLFGSSGIRVTVGETILAGIAVVAIYGLGAAFLPGPGLTRTDARRLIYLFAAMGGLYISMAFV